MRSELDVLLDKIDDSNLRADIRSQVARIQAKRTFGLVFESDLPERVRLPEHPVRVGVTVAHRDEPESAAFEVLAIKGKTVTLRKVRNPDGSFLSTEQAAEVTEQKSGSPKVRVGHKWAQKRCKCLILYARQHHLSSGCIDQMRRQATVRTTTLLKALLGMQHLRVTGFAVEAGAFVIEVCPAWRTPRCSGCQRRRSHYDTRPPRRWRHLDFGGVRVYLRGSSHKCVHDSAPAGRPRRGKRVRMRSCQLTSGEVVCRSVDGRLRGPRF